MKEFRKTTNMMTDPDLEKEDPKLGTLFEYACKRGEDEIAKILLDRRVKVSSYTKTSLLFMTISKKYFKCAKILIEVGADVKGKDKYGNTPLHIACNYPSDNDTDLTFINFLIEKGASINARNLSGNTPLHKASFPQKKEFLKILLKNGGLCCKNRFLERFLS